MSIGDVYCYSIPSIIYLFHDDNTVLTMSRDELITNSKFIRSSMEAFADDNLITEIVIRYLCAINNLGSSVDSEFIANVTKFNQIENNINYVYEKFYSRYKENIQK